MPEMWPRNRPDRLCASCDHATLNGDTKIDLTGEPGIIYNGIIRPLSMRSGVLQERRLVLVVAPPVLLPMDKHDASAGE